MTGFLLAFLGVILAGIGARDQATVVGLVERQGSRPALLLVGIATSVITAAVMAWAAIAVSPMLTAKARLFFAAMAVGLAGLESLVLSPGRKPQEPTASLGAAAIVLLAAQLTDAARFLVLGIAVALAAPWPAGIGGAAGGAAVLAAAWLAPEHFTHARLRKARRTIGLGLALLGIVLAWRAIG